MITLFNKKKLNEYFTYLNSLINLNPILILVLGFNRIVYIIFDALTLRTIAEVRGGMAVLDN